MEAHSILSDLLKKEEILWRQKSHVQWMSDGDRLDIANILTAKFRELFSSQPVTCPTDLSDLQLPKVDISLLNDFLAIPSHEDISKVLSAINQNKAPCSNGMAGIFFNTYWEIVKNDVIYAVQDFFVSGSLLLKLNESNIILIPK
ncbi:hypothetical protein PanWU01x14_314790, partial [Parasponia andersonii]